VAGLKRFFLLVVLWSALSGLIARGESLENGYYKVSCDAHGRLFVQVCPSGNGAYGQVDFQLGCAQADYGLLPAVWKFQPLDATTAVGTAEVPLLEGQSLQHNKKPLRLEPGKRLVQHFIAERPFAALAVALPTWRTQGAGVTCALYDEKGRLVARRAFHDVVDGAFSRLEFPLQPQGAYRVVLEGAKGTVGCWADDSPPGWRLTLNGKSLPGLAMRLRLWYLAQKVAVEAHLDLHGADLNFALAPGTSSALLTCWASPWVKAGYAGRYDARIWCYAVRASNGFYAPIEQYKRRDDFQSGAGVRTLLGKYGFDLQLSGGMPQPNWRMAEAHLDSLFGHSLKVKVVPHLAAAPAYYPVFETTPSALGRKLSEFFYERAYSFPVIAAGPDWGDWVTRQRCFTSHPFAKGHMDWLAHSIRLTPEGYVYTWGAKQGWPFPEGYDTRHFVTNPKYIVQCYDYYFWQRDPEFAKAIAPRLEKAARYMLESPEMRGADGLCVLRAKDHDGTAKGVSNNYWDNIPFGYKSAYLNEWFYKALLCLREFALDEHQTAKAHALEELAARCRKLYNATFWDEAKGRYIGCIDVTGQKHDYGFTYLNLEALTHGLASPEQARRIFHWLETEPTATGKADTFSRFIFAPRVNTEDNQDWWYLEGKGNIKPQPFGSHCENGGAILYVTYYELMARLKYFGPDNAFERLQAVLKRFLEPDRLCGGNPLLHGEIDGWQVGTSEPFPESGLVPTFFVYGFLGLEVDHEGLHIKPELPSGLARAGVDHLCYRGVSFKLSATHSQVQVKGSIEGKPFDVSAPYEPGQALLLEELVPAFRQQAAAWL